MSATDLKFPMKRQTPLDPPAEFRKLREESPVVKARLWNGSETWLFTRHADARAILGDSERFSTVPTRPGYPMAAPGRASYLLKELPSLIRMDPPEHTVLRRMLTREFTVKRMEAKRAEIETITTQLLDEMERSGPVVDLVKVLALPLPTLVISEMLGIPYKDHEFIQARTSVKLDHTVDPEIPVIAQRELQAYLDVLLQEKARNPEATDDILSRLMAEQVLPGHLPHADAVAMAEMLIVAGHETTATMIALGTLMLLQHPDQLQLLRSDMSLMRSAIDEMLRYPTITHLNGARVALEDVTIGGQLVRAGEGVYGLLAAANRDPEQFPDPDRFDITCDAGAHMTFGYGIHQCLGQNLAKLELDIVFRQLLPRFPELRLAVPFDSLEFKHESFVFGIKSLPVTW